MTIICVENYQTMTIMNKTIEFFDPIANEWFKGYLIGETIQNNYFVVEKIGGGVLCIERNPDHLKYIT